MSAGAARVVGVGSAALPDSEYENDTTRRYRARVPAGTAAAARCAESPLLRTAYGSRFLTRPVFLDADERAGLSDDLNRLFDLLVSLPDRLFGGDLRQFAAAVGMAPVQADAVLRGAALASGPARLGRADLYREPDGFRLLELNLGSALGGFENAEINRAVLTDLPHARFAETERLAYVDTLRAITDTMLAACADLDAPSRPVVALVDWPSSFQTLAPRLRFMADLLAPLGVDAVACHIGELEDRAGGLYVHGRRIDIVYRFFLVEDLLDGQEAPVAVARVLDAAERGAVRLFASLDAELYGSKGCLALLSDERNRPAFSAAENAFTDRFLPWTRALRDGSAHVAGTVVDLVPYVLEHQHDLVLKPTLLHGGIGVVPGWTATRDEWATHVREAVGGPFVVQRRVRPVAESFPPEDGVTAPEKLVLNWGVFLTRAGYGGAIVRGSADPDVGIVSMAGGARVGCCFHPADRPAVR